MVNTFLPYADFDRSIRCLDLKRLGKQRVEAYQIWLALKYTTETKSAWINHPAVQMWKGYEKALELYILKCMNEWSKHTTKGGKPFSNTKMAENIEKHGIGKNLSNIRYPPWFGNKIFHQSMKAKLYHKNPMHYSMFEKYRHITDYVWPRDL